MNKLRQIVLASIGHDASWHDRTVLDFTADNSPAHSLASLLNGGGKSSLISLFFSVFKPGRQHFLYKKNGDGASIDDYYDLDVPGYIATEWEFRDPKQSTMPVPGMGGRCHIVGSVGIKDSKGLSRLFFSVKVKDGLGWEQLPHPLGEAVPDFSNAAELKRWFQQQSQRYGADFLFFDHQGRWLDHLSSELGFNLHDFDIHMRMNSVEGGLVEFLKPLAETRPVQYDRDFELLRMVTELVLNESTLQEKMSTLDVLAKDLREAPAAKRAIEALTPVYDNAAIAVEKSRALAKSQQHLSGCAADARLVLAKAEEHSRRIEFEKEEMAARKTALDGTIRELTGRQNECVVDLAACETAVAGAAVLAAEAKLEVAKRSASESEIAETTWNATERYYPVVQKRKAMDAKVAAIAAEAAGQTLYDSLMGLGARLRLFLDEELRRAGVALSDCHAASEEAIRDLSRCKAHKKKVDEAYVKASSQVSTINGAIESLKARERAVREKYEIAADEHLSLALEKVSQDIHALGLRENEFQTRQAALVEEKAEARAKARGANERLEAADRERKRVGGLLARYENAVAKLRESSELAEVSGGEDILSPSIQDALRRHILGFRKRIEDLVRQKDILERVRATVEEYGVSGVPQHVRVVADFFKTHGEDVGLSADPAVSHIAKSSYYDDDLLKKNPVLAYSLICSDPAKCREFWTTMAEGVTIDLPVFLLGSADLEATNGAIFANSIIPADHWMSVPAAEEYMSQIGGDIAAVESQLAAQERRIERFEALINTLTTLQAQFDGDNAPSALKKTEADASRVITDAQTTMDAVKARIEEIDKDLEKIKESLRQLEQQQKPKNERAQELRLFLENDAPKLEKKSAELEAARTELSKAQAAVEDAASAINTAQDICTQSAARQQSAADKKAEIQKALDSIVHHAPLRSGEESDPIVDISASLAEYKSLVARYESSSLRSLLDEKDAAKAALDEETGKFERFELERKTSFDRNALEATIKEFEGDVDPGRAILKAHEAARMAHTDAVKNVGSIEEELRGLQAILKGLAENCDRVIADKRVHPSQNYAEMDGETARATRLELCDRRQQVERDLASARTDAATLAAEISALTGQIKDHGHLIVAIKSSMGMIEGYPVSYDGSSEFADPEIAESVANSDFEKVAKRLGQICTEAASKYREMESGFDATYTRLKDLLYLARDVCREIPPHAVSERAVMLDPSEAARVAGNLKDMINAYRYKLDSTSTIREQALALLSDMIRSGQRIIRYMSSSKNRLPHSILYVGDKQILVAKKGIPRSGAPEELKREADVCDRILDKIADGEIQVLSGLELSTILMREMYPKDLYPKGFDFHLVKMSDLKGSDYVSLSKMQFSGGERAVSAFFLYLLVQNVRSEFYNESMGKGGYIILDNPFANVTRADFIRAITDMATQANYQIIAFTGIKDPSLVPFFKKHIFLTTRKIQSMGREKKVVRRHEFEWKRGYDGAA